ncbi:MAG TPA: hypothetical protein ENF64_01510 [Hadesarchaea archaeon]|nr:hypothetical protein [Hadesarchaea archaeon]
MGFTMEPRSHTQGAGMGLENFLNTVVVVSVKDGRKFKGKLRQYDEHMNLIMEDVEAISSKPITKHKLILLKGGNISDVSA